MVQKKAIIIGSGIGGIATAIRLAVQGFKVEVFEKNKYPGGKISAFEKDGYHFDAGPSLFTQPKNIEELFAIASTPVENNFSYRQVDIACKYFYENGKIVTAYADKKLFEKELNEQCGEPYGTLTNYLQQSEKLYNDIGSIFLNHSLHKKNTWLNTRVLNALSTVKLSHLFKPLHHYNQHKFSSAEATQLFDRYATYNGSNPYKAPGMLSLIPHLEQNLGTYYPEGGMISITNALYSLALSKGVVFNFNAPVTTITHHAGKITGIITGEKYVPADAVISNADVYFTYKHLLNEKNKAKKILQQERSSSAVIFYWGIKKEFSQLGLHNIFFSGDYKTEFDNIFYTKQVSNDPTIYINITSKMERGMAPEGKENWFVMVNAPANTGQDWNLIKHKLKISVTNKLKKMLGENIAALIETEHTLDPITIEEKTSSYMGSLYGTSSNSKMAAFLRHPNFTGTIKGLYFCGGSVHPGGGIPLCLNSAKIVSTLVAEDYK